MYVVLFFSSHHFLLVIELTHSKCVNGFSSKNKRNTIKMMSFHRHIQTRSYSLFGLTLAKYFEYFSTINFISRIFGSHDVFSILWTSLKWEYRFLVLNISGRKKRSEIVKFSRCKLYNRNSYKSSTECELVTEQIKRLTIWLMIVIIPTMHYTFRFRCSSFNFTAESQDGFSCTSHRV